MRTILVILFALFSVVSITSCSNASASGQLPSERANPALHKVKLKHLLHANVICRYIDTIYKKGDILALGNERWEVQ